MSAFTVRHIMIPTALGLLLAATALVPGSASTGGDTRSGLHGTAAARCAFSPQPRVVMSAPATTMRGHWSGSCAGATTYAYSPAPHVADEPPYFTAPDAGGYFPHDTDVVDDTQALGVWTWVPTSGDGGPFTQVRLGSKAYLSVARSGSKVSIRTRDSRYVPGIHRWGYYSGWKGQIQWRYVGYVTWHALKNTVQDSNGVATYTWTQPYAREYRVVFPDNSVVWGSLSPTVRG